VCVRYNETFPPRPLNADEAHEVLKQKAYRQWSDLAKAFRKIDSKSDGVITRQELRDLLYKFIMPMDSEEFNKLWARYKKNNSICQGCR
jgi:Ca2+-binding EF-hand superfamily protein